MQIGKIIKSMFGFGHWTRARVDYFNGKNNSNYMFVGVKGKKKEVNRSLIMLAAQNAPVLVVDCANCANPYNFSGVISNEQLDGIHVVNAEAIYRLRAALLQVPLWAKNLGAKVIVVTTIGGLFSYNDAKENKDVIEHCFEIMSMIGKVYDIYAGIDSRSSSFADMFVDSFVLAQGGKKGDTQFQVKDKLLMGLSKNCTRLELPCVLKRVVVT